MSTLINTPPAFVLSSEVAQLLSAKIRSLLESSLSVKIMVGDYKIKAPHLASGDLYACVTMTQNDIEAFLVFSFSEEVASEIVSEVYKTKITNEKTVHDAIGEISNIIYASFKKDLNELGGYKFQLSIPKVLAKEQLRNNALFSGRTLVLPVATPAGNFEAFITIEKTNDDLV